MSQWEYQKIDLKELPKKTDDIDVLDEAGRQGWELVAIGMNHVAYLKRHVGEPAPSGRRKASAAAAAR